MVIKFTFIVHFRCMQSTAVDRRGDSVDQVRRHRRRWNVEDRRSKVLFAVTEGAMATVATTKTELVRLVNTQSRLEVSQMVNALWIS